MLSEIQPDVASTPEEKAVLTPEPTNVQETQSTEGESTAAEKPEREERTVPLAALHEERQTRKQLQAEVRAMREQQERQSQEYQIAQQRLVQWVQSQQPKAPTPDREADPLGYTAHVAERTEAQVQSLAQQQYQREQAEQQARQQAWQVDQENQRVNQLRTLTAQGEQAFKAQKPDYDTALKFAQQNRLKQYEAIGIPLDEAATMVERDTWQLAHTSLVRGENPAAVIYRLAQTMGYQGQADAAQKMEMQEAGYKASKASGGGAVRGKMTAAQIASMSATDLARLSEDEFRAVMGG